MFLFLRFNFLFGKTSVLMEPFLFFPQQAVKDNMRRREAEEKQRRAKIAKEKAEKEKQERQQKKKRLLEMKTGEECRQQLILASILLESRLLFIKSKCAMEKRQNKSLLFNG